MQAGTLALRRPLAERVSPLTAALHPKKSVCNGLISVGFP